MRYIMSGSIRCRRLARRGPGFQAAIAAALLCAVQAGAQTPTAWTNMSDGFWSNSACWDNGVPSNNNAFITATGASYTVTYDAPTNSFSNLTILNSVGYTSTLTIASTNFAPGTNVLLSTGAVVNVNTGGIWRPTLPTNITLTVAAGASLNINGGTMLYTNVIQGSAMNLSDSSSSATSVLNITSGRFEFSGKTNAYTNTLNSPNFNLGVSKPGIINVSGGTCVVQNLYGWDIGASSGGRGYANITGGELVITGQTASSTFPYTQVGNSGSYGEMNISGNGKLTAFVRQWAVGCSNGYGRFNVNGGTATVNGITYIGSRGVNSTGIVEITAGELLLTNHLYLGAEPATSNRDDTGILNIYGGKVTAEGRTWVGQCLIIATNRIGRITVTNGLLIAKQTFTVGEVTVVVGRANGELNLSDSGIISNTSALFYVGNGTGGVGVVNQSGGRYQQDSGIMYVGNNGGDGTYNMIGSQGTLNVAALTATTRTSRISFDLGTNGAGAVTVSGAVAISTNTSLTITMTNYDWLANGLTIDLISYGTLTGTFGATNVTIIGAAGALDGGSIDYGSGTSDKIRLQFSRRPSGILFHMSRRKLLPFIVLAYLKRFFCTYRPSGGLWEQKVGPDCQSGRSYGATGCRALPNTISY